jgi:multiple antibiotic resistance protein
MPEAVLEYLLFLTQVSIAMLAIMNPFYTFPSFLAATADQPPRELEAISRRSSLYAFFILTFFLLSGDLLFELFGFTLGAFKVGGGILLFLIGLNMIFEKQSSVRERVKATEQEAEERDDIALVPIAIPMLAGPGTITTVLVLKGKAETLLQESAVLVAIAAGCLMSYVVYTYSKQIHAWLGRMGVQAIVKIMGLIIIAVSIQMIVNGIKELFLNGGTV